VRKEEALDLVRVRAIKRAASFDAIPMGKPRIKHAVHHDVREGVMVGVHAVAGCSEHESRTMGSDQASDGQSNSRRVSQKPVATIEHEPFDAQCCRRPNGLLAPNVRLSVTGRLSIGQSDEEHTQAVKSELGRGATHPHLEVIRMGPEREDVGRVVVESPLTTRDAGTFNW